MSVNPYRDLPLYRLEYINSYKGCEIFERPAHIFALAEAAYRNLKQHSLNSCIVISGNKEFCFSGIKFINFYLCNR